MHEYPLTKFHFEVDWGKDKYSGFQEVTGLEVTIEQVEYRDGKDPSFIKKRIPCMKSFGELTLKRGTFQGDNDFYRWLNGDDNPAQDGMPERRTLIITMKNAADKVVLTWQINNAFPTKVTATDLRLILAGALKTPRILSTVAQAPAIAPLGGSTTRSREIACI